ncbi:uncharacterized protein LOC129256027 [Lytechinus pictus]|uniref:uncharacterized protein LOC129256027 n=1 Tax=Lytechinus pictus TaxID=7653 RepID=UPI0030BA1FCF
MKKVTRTLTLSGKKEPMKRTRNRPTETSYPKPVCLNFSDLPVEERRSYLSRFISKTTLPTCIRITKNFTSSKDAAIAFKSDEILLLCFVVKVEVVHATVGKTEYRLPLHCTQLLEPLPIEPLLDDKSYKGTKALIEATPLPEMVRVVDAEYSPDPMAEQDSGDVIRVRRVEFQDHPERGRERVLVGTDMRGEEVRFPEAMDMASYTTMISKDLVPLSELAKYDTPQRVRMPEATTHDADEPKRNKNKEKMMKIHRFYTDYHVIAARAIDDDLLSIPINSNIAFDMTSPTMDDIAMILPAVFKRTNSTWCVSDITQPRMPEPLRPVPHPIDGIFEEWAKSYEGKIKINQAYEVNISGMKKKIEERDSEIRLLKRQIPKPGPPLASHRVSFPAGVVPPRPPREYHTMQPPIRENFTTATSSTKPLKPMPLPKPSIKSNTYDQIPIKPLRPAGDEKTRKVQATIQELKSRTVQPTEDEEKKKLQATIQELKNDLFEKESKIFELLAAEKTQKERYETLRKERDELITAQATDRHQILQLQSMIDHMHNVQEGGIYEELEDVVHSSNYATPYSGKKVDKKMTVQDVGDFLRHIGLSDYVKTFSMEQIDGLMLQHLDEDIMIGDLEMRKLDARRLFTKMKQLR